MKHTVATLIMGVLLSACGGGGGGGGGAPAYSCSTDPFCHIWYDVKGAACAPARPAPGCDFDQKGEAIDVTSDPYYSTQYNLAQGSWTYTDAFRFSQTYAGQGWLSPNGILYDDFGGALNSQSQGESLDLIGDVAERDAGLVKAVGKHLAGKYALAEDKGIEIAQTLNDYMSIGKTRGRTDRDLADITQRLYGVNQDKVLPAIEKAKNGDTAALESINADVASHWGTDPETSKKIMSTWYKEQISVYQKASE